jgi:putative transposase
LEYETGIQPVNPDGVTVIGFDYSSKKLYIDSGGDSADYPRYCRKMEAK